MGVDRVAMTARGTGRPDREAANRRNREYYARNIDERRAKRREQVRAWRARNPDWREKYAKQRKASRDVTNAVRDGRLIRQPCEVCGADKVEGHHLDYDKTLEVIWLCPTHHREAHRREQQ